MDKLALMSVLVLCVLALLALVAAAIRRRPARPSIAETLVVGAGMMLGVLLGYREAVTFGARPSHSIALVALGAVLGAVAGVFLRACLSWFFRRIATRTEPRSGN